MPVLVDGNNLLYAARSLHEAGDALGRSMLCGIVGGWSRSAGHEVHIVFDGPAPPRPAAEQISGNRVDVSYSGSGSSADAVLISVIERHSAPRRLLVVSTDREIRRAARRRRAHALRSDEFWMALTRDLQRPTRVRVEPPEKRAGLRQDDATDWLGYFGLSPRADSHHRGDAP